MNFDRPKSPVNRHHLRVPFSNVEENLAAGALFYRCHLPHEGGLACAVIADDRDMLALMQDEVGIVQGVDAVARMAFPFMTFGLLSGALWAEKAWGRYWSWDPKETWALAMWLCYALYFHCRRHPKLERFALPCQIAGFAALVVTFLFVGLLPRLGSALHTYAR